MVQHLTFGQKVKTRRRQLRLTQIELSNICETSNEYICRLEHKDDVRNISARFLSKLANALQVSLDYLVNDEEDSRYKEEDKELYKIYRTLNKEDKEFVKKFVRLLVYNKDSTNE